MSERPTASYAVVKFVPDRIRFEPINIGILVAIGDTVVTRMADSIDPRVRFADPYADIESLRTFLDGFDAQALAPQANRPVLEWLHDQELSNIYVTTPQPVSGTEISASALAEALYGRLVERNFSRPPLTVGPPSRTAARRALMSAFQAVGVLGTKVASSVTVRGASGVDWTVDFRFATSTVNLVQAATTGLRDDVRGKEHAFEAFASLIDTREPGISGILASDAIASENDISSQIEKVAVAHDLRFVGGRRAFLGLAREVRDKAMTTNEPAEVALFNPET